MTRINAGIPPKKLHYQHLMSELREIKRIPNMLKRARLDLVPDKFTLGTGHVRFFYDKGKFTYERYIALYNEAIRRNYNPTDFSSTWDIYHRKKYRHLYNDWSPTRQANRLIKQRINERLKTMKQ